MPSGVQWEITISAESIIWNTPPIEAEDIFCFVISMKEEEAFPAFFFKECSITILSLYAADKETETERQNQWLRI